MFLIKKTVAVVFIIEIIIIILGNIICFSSLSHKKDRSYLVEVKHLVDECTAAGHIVPIDSGRYPKLISVSEFDPLKNHNNEYVVKSIFGSLYCIEYRDELEDHSLIYINIGFIVMLCTTVILMLIIRQKIVRPFSQMEKLTVDLAKGNLSAPVYEEKSHIFGRFLWGMDMLREKLEQNKRQEIEFRKERKKVMLSLSHDIKTPLSAIELYEKALSSGLYDTPDRQSEAYAGIHKNVGQLKRYVDEITAASRDDILSLEVNNTEFYLDDVITEIMYYYKDKFMRLHTDFKVEEHTNPLLKGDPDRLVEVLQNLLENSIKYGDGRYAGISFSEEDGACLIHVTNSGLSPSEDEILHLFDSFYRGTNAADKNGSGLGLYISRGLMRKMNGDVYLGASEESFTAVVVVMKA